MPLTDQHLFDSLNQFCIDYGESDFSFNDRLAMENGWSRTFAADVVAEYLKFVYLCSIAETPLTPSQSVDQAWHLHLLYTKSYWNSMCEAVLGKGIHHNPTTGGEEQHQLFVKQYERTLELYKLEFEQEPPCEVWPPTEIRFDRTVVGRFVNTESNIIIERKVLAAACLISIAVIMITAVTFWTLA